MSNLKTQGTKAFVWHFLGRLATNAMGFVVSIFLARLLDPSDFGLIAMIMVIIGMATVFSDVGLGAALIQRRRVRPVHYSSVFYLNIVIGAVLTLFVYLGAPMIGHFYHKPELIPLIHVMSLSFLINAFSSVQTTKLRKELNYALLTKIGLISSLLSGILGIAMAFYGFGVWSLVAQLLTIGIFSNIFIWIHSSWKPQWIFSWKALTQLWGFGFSMFLSGMIDAIYTRLDFLIIGKLFPAATLGYFQRAKSLNSMIMQYPSGSLMAILFPVLSKVQNDLVRFQNIIVESLGVVSFVTFMFLGGLYLVSEELIVLLFSEKWIPSVDMFKILVLSGFAFPISALLVNILSSRGKSKSFLKLEIYKKLVASCNLFILYSFGIDLFLYGLILQGIINVSLNIIFASREIHLPFYAFAHPLLIQAGIALLSVLVTLSIVKHMVLVGIIMLIVKGMIFVSLYIGINYIFHTHALAYIIKELKQIIQKSR